MTETWFGRDLPVLKAVVELCDERHLVDAKHVDERTGMEKDQVDAALRALRDAGYFTKASGSMGRMIDTIHGVTGEARREVGQWPTPETFADQFARELERRSETETSPEKRGTAIKMAKWFAEGGRDLFVDVAGAVVRQQTGI